MTPILSILIPTLPERHSNFIELYGKLWRQMYHVHINHESLGEIEWIKDDSKRFINGGLSIGKKRESLVQRATGKYLCFLDDDDDIAPNYVETLVRMCHEDKDVVTFRDFTTTDFYWTIIDMSLNHTEDEQATPDRIVKRKPWLVCPVRSEYAKQFEFPDINYGEDAIWMSQVLTLCKTEVHTDQILRSYKHSSKTSMADQIINAGHK
jgi:hypothetical protein